MEPRNIETEFLFEVRIPQGPHHLIGDGPVGASSDYLSEGWGEGARASAEWGGVGGGWGPVL